MHPQANEQIKAANKKTKHHLKMRLNNHKRAWVDELPSVLWAYKTTLHNATSETTYFLAFKVEAVVLVKIGLPNYRTAHFSPKGNNNNLRAKLDLLGKKQEVANLQVVTYKQCSTWYYNFKVKNRTFK